jgi:homoserine kinase
MKRVKIRVPASTTNLGPGFDSLGLALTLYNDFEFVKGQGRGRIEVVGDDTAAYADGIGKLIKRTMRAFSHTARFSHQGVSVTVRNRIPVARGLGSSATYIVGTLMGLNALSGGRLKADSLLERAALIEGHPDNVAPALKGGLVATSQGKELLYSALPCHSRLKIFVASPNFTVYTRASRKLLPKKVSFQDATFNVGRTALLIAALTAGRDDLLSAAMSDRLHQPYRAKRILGAQELLSRLSQIKNCGASLSGSGPSILVIAGPSLSTKKLYKIFNQVYRREGKTFELFSLKVDPTGARALRP